MTDISTKQGLTDQVRCALTGVARRHCTDQGKYVPDFSADSHRKKQSIPLEFVDIENSSRSCSTIGASGPKLAGQGLNPGRRGERSSTSEAVLLPSRLKAGKADLLKKFSWCDV